MKFNVSIKKVNKSFLAHIEFDNDNVTILGESLEEIYKFIDKTLKRILEKDKLKGGKK